MVSPTLLPNMITNNIQNSTKHVEKNNSVFNLSEQVGTGSFIITNEVIQHLKNLGIEENVIISMSSFSGVRFTKEEFKKKIDTFSISLNKKIMIINSSIEQFETIAEWLRTVREIKDLTQPEMAKLSGIAKSTISFIENGINLPSIDYGFILCKILNIDPVPFSDKLITENISRYTERIRELSKEKLDILLKS